MLWVVEHRRDPEDDTLLTAVRVDGADRSSAWVVDHGCLPAALRGARLGVVPTDGVERLALLDDASLVVVRLPATDNHVVGIGARPRAADAVFDGLELVAGEQGTAEGLDRDDDVVTAIRGDVRHRVVVHTANRPHERRLAALIERVQIVLQADAR